MGKFYIQKIKKIKPLFNRVLIQIIKQDLDYSKVGIMSGKYGEKGEPKLLQKVYAIGDMVSRVKVGDYVAVDWEKYMVPLTKSSGMNIDGEKRMYINILESKPIWIGDEPTPYYMISENDILYVAEEIEEQEVEIPLIEPLEKPKIIV